MVCVKSMDYKKKEKWLDKKHIKYLPYIDLAKGIGILFVILGHLLEHPKSSFELSLKAAIYCFHMPLFFILTGLTYHPCNKTTLRDTIIYSLKRKKYLLISYGIYSVVFIIKDIFIKTSTISILWDIYKTVIFNGINVLWFLSTLVLVEILFDLMKMMTQRLGWKQELIIFITVSVMFSVMYKCTENYIPNRGILFLVQTGIRPISVVAFFYMGWLFKQYNIIDRVKKAIESKISRIFVFSICMLVILRIGILNGLVDIHNICFGNSIILSYFVGISASVLLILLCAETNTFSILTRAVMYFGKNSLFIMISHNYLGVRSFAEFFASQIFTNSILKLLDSFVIVIIVETILILIIGRKLDQYIRAASKIHKYIQ